MHGVPHDLPVDSFIGKKFNQICVGRFQIQFHASGTGSISAESRWELRDHSGVLVDSQQEHTERGSYRIHAIIDVPIIQIKVVDPSSFSLYFQNGMILTIYDDSQQYESFSINLDGRGGIFI